MGECFEDLLKRGCDSLARKEYGNAEIFLKEALAVNPEDGRANHLTGLVLALEMKPQQALPFLKKAAETEPSNIQFRYNLATTLYQVGQYQQAASHFEQLLAVEPNHIGALVNLGAVYNILGYPCAAEKLLRRAIRVDSDQVMLYINLGNALEDQGRVEEAVKTYEKAIALDPVNIPAHSNRLLALCYLPRLTNHRRFNEHVLFESSVGKGIKQYSHGKSRKTDGTVLRIGYVSSDFRRHSVAYFLEPILRSHTRSCFQVFCYSDVVVADEVTRRLKSYAFAWRNIAAASNQDVAGQIIEDRIDILVDLAGHSAQNRMGLFIMKPAPVQVTYLGYPATTGLSTMDYRLTDEFADPPGQQRFHTEALFRLSPSFLCYTPPENAPNPSSLPCERNGFITFGSFNNLPKITDDVVEIWARILKGSPGSRLVIKARQNKDPQVRQKMFERFAAHGIEWSRLILEGHKREVGEHLAQYNRIDIALDTFPYNGTTTTFESILMGVAVISLKGNHHAARVGYSIMSNIGLGSLVAQNCDDYVAKALFLSRHTTHLASLRKSLRSALLNSPLCDSIAFTVKLENAFRKMV